MKRFLLLAALVAAPVAAEPGVHIATIFSAERSAALKPPVDAQVESVAVREGAAVKRGTLLVQLDDRQQRARVALARTSSSSGGEIDLARVRLTEAQAKLDSTEKAAKVGAAEAWELRQARAAAAQSAEEQRMARDRQSVERRRLGVEQTVLDGLRIRAPFDGRVTRLNARPGATVRQSDTVAVVTDLSTLRGEAYVRARFFGLLKQGRKYAVRFDAPFAATATATLAYVDPVMDAGAFRAVFVLDNMAEKVPSGLEGRIILRPPTR